MLNLGFNKIGIKQSHDVSYSENKNIVPPNKNNPIVKYAQNYNEIKNTTYNMGTTGVQFGAFSTTDAAKKQAARVKNIIGMNPDIEKNDTGLYRVRVNGISESDAVRIKNLAVANGIDCYIFH